jgi:hypothetical protein
MHFFSSLCKVGCVPRLPGPLPPCPRRRRRHMAPPGDFPDSLAAALDAVLIAAFTGRLGELIAEARRLRERERLTYDALNTMKEGGDS